MRKIDSSKIVCTAAQVQNLISLGIEAHGVFCYEWQKSIEDGSAPDDYVYVFTGEYIDQDVVIPAWTYEELCVMIGGDTAKPDLYSIMDFTVNRNLLQYPVYFPKSMREFPNGAQAAAAQLEYMLQNGHIIPEECNDRYTKFYEKTF